MKISWYGRTPTGRYRMDAVPGDYDGVPTVPSLLVDHWPSEVHDDVMAVAGVLAFGEYVGGAIEFSREVSAEVAQEIQTFLAPSWCNVTPVSLIARPNPIGSGQLVLSNSIESWNSRESSDPSSRISQICVVPGSSFSGSIVSPSGLLVAANTDILAHTSREKRVLAPLIAVGLLFVESFRANTLVLDESLSVHNSNEDVTKYQTLLASAKVRLVV